MPRPLDPMDSSLLGGDRYRDEPTEARCSGFYERGWRAGRHVAIEAVMLALTSEDEVAHGEAYEENRGGLGVCAYCDDEWPCRTQRGIDRLLRALGVESKDEGAGS